MFFCQSLGAHVAPSLRSIDSAHNERWCQSLHGTRVEVRRNLRGMFTWLRGFPDLRFVQTSLAVQTMNLVCLVDVQ